MSVSSLASSVIVNRGGLAMLITVMQPESQEHQRHKCTKGKYVVYPLASALSLGDASRTFRAEYMVQYFGAGIFAWARPSER
jgi:hypothetical protein